jgi:hypothetical protein
MKMPRQLCRNHSLAFKAKEALEGLRGDKTVASSGRNMNFVPPKSTVAADRILTHF